MSPLSIKSKKLGNRVGSGGWITFVQKWQPLHAQYVISMLEGLRILMYLIIMDCMIELFYNLSEGHEFSVKRNHFPNIKYSSEEYNSYSGLVSAYITELSGRANLTSNFRNNNFFRRSENRFTEVRSENRFYGLSIPELKLPLMETAAEDTAERE